MVECLNFQRPLVRERDGAPVRILAMDLKRGDGLQVVFAAIGSDGQEEVGTCRLDGTRSGDTPRRWAIVNA